MSLQILDNDGLPVAGIQFVPGDIKISIGGGEFVNTNDLPATRRIDSATIDLDFLSAEENVAGAEIVFADQIDPNDPNSVAEWQSVTVLIEEDQVLEEVTRIPDRAPEPIARGAESNKIGTIGTETDTIRTRTENV